MTEPGVSPTAAAATDRLDRCSPRDTFLHDRGSDTEEFLSWFDALKDMKARVRVQVRIDRLALGNPGDVKSVGQGVSELRIAYAGGYRVYFMRKGRNVVVVLAGGDKSTQQSDILAAQALAKEV